MAVLTLTRAWLNRLDTGAAVSALSGYGKAQAYSLDGEVSTWAGGRQRSMTTEGERGSMTVRMLMVSTVDVGTIRSWKGLPVQFRDARGVRFFGTFFAVTVAERRDPDLWDVEFALLLLTVTEGA